MDQKVFNDVLKDTEKVVNGFKVEDLEGGNLINRIKDLFEMVKSYDLPLEQKIYVFKKGVFLLVAEVVHDVFPANDYFRENSLERFLVFQTPGQDAHEKAYFEKWNNIQRGNWARQGEIEDNSNKGAWWS